MNSKNFYILKKNGKEITSGSYKIKSGIGFWPCDNINRLQQCKRWLYQNHWLNFPSPKLINRISCRTFLFNCRNPQTNKMNKHNLVKQSKCLLLKLKIKRSAWNHWIHNKEWEKVEFLLDWKILATVLFLIISACYFNSLLQTYFQNVEFVKEILKYEIP